MSTSEVQTLNHYARLVNRGTEIQGLSAEPGRDHGQPHSRTFALNHPIGLSEPKGTLVYPDTLIFFPQQVPEVQKGSVTLPKSDGP